MHKIVSGLFFIDSMLAKLCLSSGNPKSEPDIWPNGRLGRFSFERQLIIYMSVDKLWIRQGEEILQTAQG
ncbi:hypothetical protein CS388_02600 [Porphyromonas gingivalis]|nr:hypothetical protein CS545_08065 [Porphyromonas gingivalis]ATS08025.1 hypothetical protein CS388_02600 [Porphyromonas gingivalis]